MRALAGGTTQHRQDHGAARTYRSVRLVQNNAACGDTEQELTLLFDGVRDAFHTQFRLLAFRPAKPNLRDHLPVYCAYVVAVTWIVGVGRYWDHPSALSFQYAGVGSLLYVCVLSAVLYLVVLPLKPSDWSFRKVFIFVGMTSLPAVLYAVPVERFLSLGDAQTVNAWFLVIVATWRVALYVRFLSAGAGLGLFSVIIATLLPLSAIVVTLSALNLEHVVFELMAGNRDVAHSPNDTAYLVVFALSVFAYIAFPLTLASYLVAVWRIRRT